MKDKIYFTDIAKKTMLSEQEANTLFLLVYDLEVVMAYAEIRNRGFPYSLLEISAKKDVSPDELNALIDVIKDQLEENPTNTLPEIETIVEIINDFEVKN